MRITVLFALLFLSVNPAFGETETEAQADCFQLLEKRCQRCHYLERVCQEVEKKSKRQWKATLKRMVKRRGATLEGNEQESLLGCLSTPAPDITQGCKQHKR